MPHNGHLRFVREVLLVVALLVQAVGDITPPESNDYKMRGTTAKMLRPLSVYVAVDTGKEETRLDVA